MEQTWNLLFWVEDLAFKFGTDLGIHFQNTSGKEMERGFRFSMDAGIKAL